MRNVEGNRDRGMWAGRQVLTPGGWKLAMNNKRVNTGSTGEGETGVGTRLCVRVCARQPLHPKPA